RTQQLQAICRRLCQQLHGAWQGLPVDLRGHFNFFSAMTTSSTSRTEYRQAYYAKNKSRALAQVKAYYEANKEHIAKKQREYNQAHRDRKAATNRAYKQRNKERILAQRKGYYARRREVIVAQAKEYYQRNKARVKAQYRSKQAMKSSPLAMASLLHPTVQREGLPSTAQSSHKMEMAFLLS
ncbi:unnamed protein product, partial [Aphanomyces euteiches]